MDKTTTFPSLRARTNAASPHGSHATAVETVRGGSINRGDYNERMLVLRYVGLLALTLWVGGLIVLGAIVAPSVFEVLAARHIASDRLVAGAVFGEILRRYHVLSFACGAVLLGTLILRGVMGPRPIMFSVRLVVAFLMLVATAYSGMIVAPRIERVQASAGVAPSTLPENDPRRIEFQRLHKTSTGIQAVPILGALFLLFRELKD